MNTKTVQWLVLTVSGIVLILFVKIMLEMSGAVVEMTGYASSFEGDF